VRWKDRREDVRKLRGRVGTGTWEDDREGRADAGHGIGGEEV